MRKSFIGLIAIAISAWGCNSSTSTTVVGVTLAPAAPTVVVGQTLQISATVSYSDGSQNVVTSSATWTSSNTSVATISNAGLLTALSTGTSTIRAFDPSSGLSALELVTVTNGNLASIQVSPALAQIPLGTIQTFQATGMYSDQVTANLASTIQWSSSDPTILSIDSTGKAQSLKAGIVTVTALDSGSGISAKATVSVTQAVLQSIVVGFKNPQVPAGVTDQAAAMGTYSDGSIRDITSSVTWSSENTTQATVSTSTGSEGLVSPLQAGSVTIQAMDPITGVSANASLTITNATLVSIQVAPNPAQVLVGKTITLNASGTFSDGSSANLTSSSLLWSTSDPTVSGNGQGQFTGVASGTATIQVTDPVTGVSTTSVIAVADAILVSIDITAQWGASGPSIGDLGNGSTCFQWFSNTAPFAGTAQLKATGTYSNGWTADISNEVNWNMETTQWGYMDSNGYEFMSLVSIGSGTVFVSDCPPGTSCIGSAPTILVWANAPGVTANVNDSCLGLNLGT